MLKRIDWRALQVTGDDVSEPVKLQLEFAFSSAPRNPKGNQPSEGD
jgi:hypothetical protein